MTEAVSPTIPANHELVQVRHFEAGPPAGLELVEPGDTFATTKEEEWVSKKKTELTTTRQIETRVKRQVVLEDGKVVEDSGPIVTTNTSEDTEKQEHSQTELRKNGDDEVDNVAAIEAAGSPAGSPTEENKLATVGKDWIQVANPDGVVREVKERRVVSREETEEVRETEDVHHLGDITDEDFIAAVHSGTEDLRPILRDKSLDNGTTVVSTGPRIVHETTKTRRTTDTEDTNAVSSVRPDGKIVTETTRTTEHEELKDEPLAEDAVVDEKTVENSQRYQKTKDQEFVEYLADGVKIGTEMRYKAETMEGERHGEGGLDEQDWDSLSTRMRRNRRQQLANARSHPQKPKGIEDQVGPPLDRKDALTKKPLDFDEEEETRKAETSKWLENHFGSESTRSSGDSIAEDEPTNSKSFFNVTIKSQPVRIEPVPSRTYATTTRVYSPTPEPERERVTPLRNGYYQGITEWGDRKHEEYRTSSSPFATNGYHGGTLQRQSKYREESTPIPPERKRAVERRQRSSQDSRYDSGYRTHSRNEMSRDSHDEPLDEPPPDYSPPPRHSPPEMLCTPPPTPPPLPSVKKSYQRTRFAPESPSPVPVPSPAPLPPKPKPGNIIGQSIRKLVGKIRSASAERKKNRAKRSPSPHTTYQQYENIDSESENIPRRRGHHDVSNHTPSRGRGYHDVIHHTPPNGGRGHRDVTSSPDDVPSRLGREAVMLQRQTRAQSPVQRYYLGEDPFGGSIYGRENKYDGVKPARKDRRIRRPGPDEEEARSHSTLGRFSKSTSRLANDNNDYTRSAQTLPRNIRTDRARNSPASRQNTINVSIVNSVGPAKPARTYKSHLSRSKSFNIQAGAHESNMYKSNPHLHRLEENPIGLKSPGIVSSISRSTKDLTDETTYTSRYRNGYEANDQKKMFLKGLKERAPDLYKTLQSDDEEQAKKWPNKTRIATYNHGDIYEPPTRLNSNDSYLPARRRGSNSTDDYSETYHTTTRNDDPKRPSVTDTVKTFSKKTLPNKTGRSMQTIESTETKSVTRSRFRGEPMKYLENGKLSNSSNGGVVIEVKNYRN